MTQTVTATYTGGVLRPATPLPLAEGETVQVTISRPAAPLPPPQTMEEAVRRIREAKTLEEMFAALNESAGLEPDDGYDLSEALNENRRLAGEPRLLFRPEDKGKTW
jgi:predicted DNA-binding antitoxin AbrB/MazE fold protein